MLSESHETVGVRGSYLCDEAVHRCPEREVAHVAQRNGRQGEEQQQHRDPAQPVVGLCQNIAELLSSVASVYAAANARLRI